MSDLAKQQSERSLLRKFQNILGENRNLLRGSEDASAIKLGDQIFVINVDGWVESSDRPDGLDFEGCGYRATINACSDLVAKGVRPVGLLSSISIQAEASDHSIEVVKGIKQATDTYSISYLGGDLNSANDLVIDITVFGLATKQLIKRGGSKPGEKLCWLGPTLGETSLALQILLGKIEGNKSKALKIYASPCLYLDFLEIQATSAIDCSDGLARSLYQLSETGNIGFRLHDFQPNLWVKSKSEANQLISSDVILYGGEELGVIFTLQDINLLPPEGIILGDVTESLD
ncbi:MAG: thiamine-monophosphate kinase, partial [Candidatus Heimdallarchaeota archaeon]|nr:thiamine-monophosphate kinase [Candidatus Heimdallarchaeota archaeon]